MPIYIKKGNQHYRFSSQFATAYQAEQDAKGWRAIGTRTVVRKEHDSRYGTVYAVYYSISAAQYRTLVGHSKQTPYRSSRKAMQTKKRAKGSRNVYEIFGI